MSVFPQNLQILSVRFPYNSLEKKYDSQRPLFGADFLGQILAADALPGAFVHSDSSLAPGPPKTEQEKIWWERKKHMNINLICGIVPGLGRWPNFRKSVVSIKFPPVILGPEMAAPILWAPGIFGSFCWKTPMPIKFLLLGGGGFWVFLEGGGGSANFIFMGVGIFPKISEIWRRGGIGKGVFAQNCPKLTFKFATNSLPLTYETQTSGNFAQIWRAVCDNFAQRPLRERPLLGISENYVYVCESVFGGHSFWGRKTHKQKFPQIPGQSHEILSICSFLRLVFIRAQEKPKSETLRNLLLLLQLLLLLLFNKSKTPPPRIKMVHMA